MDYVTIILSAAKAAKVSGILLLAICAHESNDFTETLNMHDRGSPSYGGCQLKKNTAEFLGFRGKAIELMNPRVNAHYAALYLKYQESRYGSQNWCQLTSAYNSGSFSESQVVPGKPKNLKYVRSVQRKLPDQFKERLSCEEVAEQ